MGGSTFRRTIGRSRGSEADALPILASDGSALPMHERARPTSEPGPPVGCELWDARRARFEEIYHENVGNIYAICLRMTSQADLAAEVCQDTFLNAWRDFDSFRGDSKVTTWLHRIAVRRVLHRRRTDRRYRMRVVTDSELTEYAQAARHALVDTRLDLERAIAKLPDGARTVLILYEIEGYPYSEIASMLGVSIGTVRSQLHRARRLMRDQLR